MVERKKKKKAKAIFQLGEPGLAPRIKDSLIGRIIYQFCERAFGKGWKSHCNIKHKWYIVLVLGGGNCMPPLEKGISCASACILRLCHADNFIFCGLISAVRI